MRWPDKDPDEVLDYKIDWSQRLDDEDEIQSSQWICPDGISQQNASFDGGSTVIWLSGGTIGSTYTLTNRVVTVGGRTMDWSVRLRITAK